MRDNLYGKGVSLGQGDKLRKPPIYYSMTYQQPSYNLVDDGSKSSVGKTVSPNPSAIGHKKVYKSSDTTSLMMVPNQSG